MFDGGLVRAKCARKELGLPLISAAELTLNCGLRFVLLAATRPWLRQVGQTHQRVAGAPAPKGSYRLARADLLAACWPGARG